ncbi:VOC family protein [Nocardia sp. NPDC088792]|uniref:VOC family protein n=1 Tax=Nocardia sp. NPDC088792 TaxID=3364332 RepID=UPI0038133B82
MEIPLRPHAAGRDSGSMSKGVIPVRSRPDGGSGSSDPAIDRLYRDGRLVSMPTMKARRRALREALLSHIARTYFEPEVVYTEGQVNRRLAAAGTAILPGERTAWMTSRLEGLTLDSADPRRLAEFWCGVLGYVVYQDKDGSTVEIGPDPEVPDDQRLAELRGGPAVPNMMFVRVRDPKSGKNRLHFDICPIDSDQETELNRLQALGAAKVDVGQGDGRTWVVLADPEGNEFCLSRSLAPGQFDLHKG